jgi:hypothetical protein
MDKQTKRELKEVAGFLGKVALGVGAIAAEGVCAVFRIPPKAAEFGALELMKEIEKWEKE